MAEHTQFTMSQFLSKDDLIAAQAKRIEELEAAAQADLVAVTTRAELQKLQARGVGSPVGTMFHPAAEGFPVKLYTAPQAQPADALDAARLMFLMDETDGFVIVEKDKYDFAIECAGEAGREEPTAADELNGVRRLLDAAMAAAQEGRKA